MTFGAGEKVVTVSIVNLSRLEGATRIDSEFYQPKYLQVRSAVAKFDYVRIKEIAKRCKKGIFDIKAASYTLSGVPFVRISDLKNGFIDDSAITFIPSELHNKEIKTEFHKGDIVLSKTAYPAASIVLFERCNISQDIIGISVRGSWKTRLLPGYIVTFLNSKYGLPQMEQWFQGNIQMHLALSDAKRITVPILPHDLQKQVSRLHLRAHEQLRNQNSLYIHAENLLLKELRLEGFRPKYDIAYVATLSKAFAARRVDAEYFQPTYEQLVGYIRKRNHRKIRDIQTFNKRGVQPSYIETGEVGVVTSKHLGRISIDYEKLDKTALDEWEKNTEAQIRPLDILVYTTGAYVGTTNCFLMKTKALASNHVNILRLKKLDPIYVSVYLNSILGQMQVQRRVSGSAQVELYPSDISNFILWEAPESLQHEIATLVHRSNEARVEAMKLLDGAKNKVELAISGDKGPTSSR